MYRTAFLDLPTYDAALDGKPLLALPVVTQRGDVTVREIPLDLPDGALRLPDPVAATDPRVDALVARMEREPRLASSAAYVEAVPERVEDVATWSGRPGVG